MKAKIESSPIQNMPDCTGYQITAISAEAVQDAITEIMKGTNVVSSEFYNPRRIRGGEYQSRGYVRQRLSVVR